MNIFKKYSVPKTCPKCGGKVVKIIYGEPTEEHGYEIYLEPDEEDVRTKHGFNVRQYIRMRPKGSTAIDGIIV